MLQIVQERMKGIVTRHAKELKLVKVGHIYVSEYSPCMYGHAVVSIICRLSEL